MPIVNVKLSKLERLLGRRLAPEEAAEALARLGLGVEEITADAVKAEYNPNRPDFSSLYGIARALQGVYGVKTGAPKYRIARPKVIVTADRSVEGVRPFIVCGVVRGVSLDEDDLEDLITMQEDLHWILGRGRRKVAIGLHNLDSVEPPFIYKATKPDETPFIPLKATAPMTPREILERHEIGSKYAHLLSGYGEYPVIVDARGDVLSMPPIINSSRTELKPGVRNVFIDVTGTDWEKVNQALNILVAALVDAGGRAEGVILRYPNRRYVTPSMREGRIAVKRSYVNSLLGLSLQDGEIARLLKAMRLDAKAGKGVVKVSYPAYRVDIMHPVDLVEEVAIAYGYGNMELEPPPTLTFGSLLPDTYVSELLRDAMIGMGYTEVFNTLLTNENNQYAKMLAPEEPRVKLLNPATREYTMIRTWIIPDLLRNLADNQRNLYPQRIFEIGDVVKPDLTKPEKAVRLLHLAAASCHGEAGFNDVKSLAEELARVMELEINIQPAEHPSFIPGRTARLTTAGGEEIGLMGEIHPQVLENHGLPMPAAALEIKLWRIYQLA